MAEQAPGQMQTQQLAAERDTATAGAATAGAATHPLLQVQRMAGNRAALVQAKLVVGHAADPAELQADAIADAVLARLRAAPDEPNDEEDGTVVRRAATDFAEARVHHENGADRMSRRLQARASTGGRDIFFSPGTNEAQRTIRRYSKPTSDYTLAKGENAPSPFSLAESHVSIMPREETTAPGFGVGFAMSNPDKPPLFVSDDKTMAINSQEGEPKEFYATPEVIDQANEALELFESPIMLVKAGNQITLNGSSTPLEMVRPVRRKGPAPGLDDFVSLNIDVCRDVANWIIGSTDTFNYARVGNQRVKASSDQQTISGLHEVAETMTKGGSVEDAKTAQAKGEVTRPTLVGEEYGKKLGKGELDEKSKELGVNEYAKAKIGEAYATQTVGNATGPEKMDYAFEEGKGKEHEFVWGYHFAAVVAQSLDGKDQITLENYARKADEAAARKLLLAELKDKFAARLTTFIEDNKATEQQRIGQILHFLEKNTQATEDEAKKAYNAMADEQLNKRKSFWYFRMVGEQEGQSFHEQMASSTYFANPLTVAMGRNEAASMTEVFFKEGSSTIPADRVQILTNVANKFQSDKLKHRNARLRVTGYSSGEAFGTKSRKESKRQETAQSRIDAVVELLVKQGVQRTDIDEVVGDRPDNWSATQARRVQVEVVDRPG